jgi:hypothetical protein
MKKKGFLGTTKVLLVLEIETMTGDVLNTLRKAGLDVLCVGETGDDALRIASEKNRRL